VTAGEAPGPGAQTSPGRATRVRKSRTAVARDCPRECLRCLESAPASAVGAATGTRGAVPLPATPEGPAPPSESGKAPRTPRSVRPAPSLPGVPRSHARCFGSLRCSPAPIPAPLRLRAGSGLGVPGVACRRLSGPPPAPPWAPSVGPRGSGSQSPPQRPATAGFTRSSFDVTASAERGRGAGALGLRPPALSPRGGNRRLPSSSWRGSASTLPRPRALALGGTLGTWAGGRRGRGAGKRDQDPKKKGQGSLRRVRVTGEEAEASAVFCPLPKLL
jgi:hypothetical protein